MKKFILSSLSLLLFVGFSYSQKTDTLYFNENPTAIFNPGLNSQGRPTVVFDDINVFAETSDSIIAVTRLKYGIYRPANAPATTVNFYYTSLNTSASNYDNLLKVPPVSIATLNLPAGGATVSQFYINIGDSINPIFKVSANTNAIFKDFSTFFIGLSFSNPNGAYWITSNEGNSDDFMWIYNADSTVKSYAATFGAPAGQTPPEASFVAQVYGYYTQTTLPITLSSFKASLVNDDVVLNWKTESESNSSHFVVEVSKNAREFTEISTVNASGNSSIMKNYSYTHLQPSSGIYYYRLKMVDNDNSYKYSSIEKIVIENRPIVLKVFPNPVTNAIQFNWLEEGNFIYRIFDFAGKQTLAGKVVTGLNKINMSTSSSGVYYINVVDEKGQITRTVKLIKK
jgi:hypothetical protein